MDTLLDRACRRVDAVQDRTDKRMDPLLDRVDARQDRLEKLRADARMIALEAPSDKHAEVVRQDLRASIWTAVAILVTSYSSS